MIKDLFRYIDEHTNEYVNFLKEICSFEGTAKDKKEIDAMNDYITKFSVSKGFKVERTAFDTCGDFLTIDINDNQSKSSVFLAHTDTVHKKGSFGSPCVNISDGKMYGPGTIDCKGGIAIALLVMEALFKCGFAKHTRLLLTSDEEVSNVLGGEKEQKFFKDKVKGFKSALNCEITKDNEIIVSRKGILRQRIEISGRGGHSGIDYFNSSSAVLEAAKKIVALETASEPGGTSYNCGVVNGGEVANIVPDKCYFIVDVRVVDLDSMKKAEKFIREVVATSYVNGTSATVTTISSRPPMMRNKDTQKLFDLFQAVSRKYELGELVAIESGGGSDSAYTQAAGIPSLCGLGGCGEYCHTTKEYINIESISQRAKLLSTFCIEQEEK